MKQKLFLLVFLGCLCTPFLTVSTRSSILFSPYDKPTSQLIDLIRQAQTSIHAAVYMVTDKDIAQALIDAYKRKVDVRIITDVISTGSYGKADLLAENGVPVYVLDVNARPKKSEPVRAPSAKIAGDDRWFSNDPIMHHKFMVIDGVYLWTGSFNWTGAANKKNHENVLATNDREICKTYAQHFLRIISDGSCKPYFPGRISAYMPTSLAGKVIAAINEIDKEEELARELLKIVSDHKLCTLKALN